MCGQATENAAWCVAHILEIDGISVKLTLVHLDEQSVLRLMAGVIKVDL